VTERVPDASEAMFQKDVVRLATMYEWLVHHVRPGRYGEFYKTDGLPGMPDLVLISLRNRGVIFAELKTARGRLNENQLIVGKALMQNGAEYYVWRPNDMQNIADRLAGKPS
jgi:hypothetical protein